MQEAMGFFKTVKRGVCAAVAVAAVAAQAVTDDCLTQVLDGYVRGGRIAGIVSAISDREGNVRFDSFGLADRTPGAERPMTPDTVFAVFSMSKTFCGAAVMCAIDEGRLSLDDPAAKFIPAFANVRMKDGTPVRRAITIRDLMTHMSGTRKGVGIVKRSVPLAEVARMTAAEPLATQPGEAFAYNNSGIDSAAACLEVAVGESYETYLRRKVLDPLGMRDTTFWPDTEQLKRLVRAYTSDDTPLKPAADYCAGQLVFPLTNRVVACASAGLFSTPRDMIKFSQMLAGHGSRGCRTIISRETFDGIFSVKQTPASIAKTYTCGSWLYGDWFGHEGAMRTDQRANLRTGHARVFFIQTENRGGSAFFQLKKDWHAACDRIQGTPATVFGN